MALTIYTRTRPFPGTLGDYDLPLPAFNRVLQDARKVLQSGQARHLDAPGIQADYRNRRIVKAAEEILNVVIPSLQGAAAILEDSVFGKSAAPMKNSLESQVEALKTSIATSVRLLNKALDMKNTDSPESVGLFKKDKAKAQPGEKADPSGERVSATKAIASARKHLQALHLPDSEGLDDEEGSASRIAKTLDDVVFQTNLLTLNAAVETYRTDEVQANEEKAVPTRRASGKKPGRDPKKTDLLSESS